jgi:alkylation response protein AidB-like acyl-CoA dehydrogenase
MPFFQTPPELDNQYDADRLLRQFLARRLPADMLSTIEPELRDLGALSAGPLYRQLLATYADQPKLVQWDPWGHRVDTIEITPLWQNAARIAAEKGLVATAYEREHAELSRIHQFSLVYLFDPSTAVYTCPLAMTDGAAKTLLAMGNRALIDRAIPRLTSRDPAKMWTSGQWMTERTGGSDVAISETVAKKDGDGWRLYGTKWFTSATTSQMALTLARPEGNPPGGHGLAMFYVELRDDNGRMQGITVNRLKDKLGTRMVPTAELTLDGAPATAVSGTTDGIKHITPMLAATRTWNAVCAVAGMRRAIALSRDYARRRVAFGAPLSQKPLHTDTLADMQAEYEGAFLLAFYAAELLGKEEAGTLTEEESHLHRLVVPLAKLTTAKQAVAVVSEALESFGGAGYIEDTGLPRMLRDAQVLPIWEGTTNVLSLDVLRALAKGAKLDALARDVARRTERAADIELAAAGKAAQAAVAHAERWLHAAMQRGPAAVEAGARRFALTLGRALELALLVEHATWALERARDPRSCYAAKRLSRRGVDLVLDETGDVESAALANDDG